MKIQNKNFYFLFLFFYKNTNLKLYKSKEGKTITTFYTFCVKLSGELEKEKKKEQEVFKVA